VEFSTAVPGGALIGWEAGSGTPALILHGGPTSDNTDSLVPLLPDSLRTIRYQQRGIPPSTVAEPYDVETHVADAIRVLDDRGVDQAWLIGHSWGGHLAFHIAVAHADRVRGVVAIDALGAVSDGGWDELDSNLVERLARDAPEDAARAQEIDERAMAGEGTDTEVLEAFELSPGRTTSHAPRTLRRCRRRASASRSTPRSSRRSTSISSAARWSRVSRGSRGRSD
jgi:pimeloyl-ACP methyl ester carboxylesterase